MTRPESDAAKHFAEEREGKPKGGDHDHESHRTPGTVALTLIFLGCFALYYFANWKSLADVWPVR